MVAATNNAGAPVSHPVGRKDKMNISHFESPRNTPYPDLQADFEDTTPKKRRPCPLCREEGHDTSGNNLSIGDGHVKCFRKDPEHGDILFRLFVNAGSFDPQSKFHRPRPLKNKAVRKTDKLSHLDRQSADRNRYFEPDGLLMAAATYKGTPGDLDLAVKVGKRCVVSRDLRGYELLKISVAFGTVFQLVKDTVEHGQFLKTLEASGVVGEGNIRWAQRAMKLVRDVADPLSFPSVNAAFESTKVPKESTKRDTVTISRPLYEAQLKEISDLRKITSDPSTVDEVKRLKVNEKKLIRRLAVSEAQNKRYVETIREQAKTIDGLNKQVAESGGKEMKMGWNTRLLPKDPNTDSVFEKTGRSTDY